MMPWRRFHSRFGSSLLRTAVVPRWSTATPAAAVVGADVARSLSLQQRRSRSDRSLNEIIDDLGMMDLGPEKKAPKKDKKGESTKGFSEKKTKESKRESKLGAKKKQFSRAGVVEAAAEHSCAPVLRQKEHTDQSLEELKSAFGEHWATFVEKIPDWEKHLKLAGYDSIVAILVAMGYPPEKTPGMATGLVEYFPSPGVMNTGAVQDEDTTCEAFKKLCLEQDDPPKVPDKQRRRRMGSQKIDDEMLKEIRKLFDQNVLDSQDTLAMVLVGASGVGKTFSAISFPVIAAAKEKNLRFLLAYVGFNITFKLSSKEICHLDEAVSANKESQAAEAVSRVVLARLYAALLLLRKHKNELTPPPDCDAFPLVPVIDSDTVLSVSPAKLKARVKTAALALQREDKKKVVVTVNLDEAQKLDECVKLAENPLGARFGLRVLRECQGEIYNASNGQVLLFPIATGINPNTSLTSQTAGSNRPTSSTLLTRDEFIEFTRKVHGNAEHCDLYAAAAFPRVREMLKETLQLVEIEVTNCDKEGAANLIEHAFSGSPLSRAVIPTQIATRAAANRSVPILDFPVWESLLECLRLAPDPKPPFRPPLSFGEETNQTFFDFEKQGFHLIGFTLELLWNVDPVMETVREAFIATNAAFSRVFGFSAAFKCRRFAFPDPMMHYYPFEGLDTHQAAADGLLADKLVEKVEAIAPGDAMLFLNGGRAPLDYLLLKKDADGKRCFARYGDAKHQTIPEKPGAQEDLEREAKGLIPKARMVHKGLQRELKKLDLELDDSFALSVLTNVPTSDSRIKAKVDGVEGTVTVLGPNTFNFEPWTSLVYRMKPTSEHALAKALTSTCSGDSGGGSSGKK